MQFHDEHERALIESFRNSGGKKIIFFRQGKPQLEKSVAKALSRLLRSGHVVKDCSGDFGWVQYRLRE